MDGCARTATELSAVADISRVDRQRASGASVANNVLLSRWRSRHRYFRLAGSDIAELLERLMAFAWATSTPPQNHRTAGFAACRTCYDHLAGEVAVRLFDTLVSVNG